MDTPATMRPAIGGGSLDPVERLERRIRRLRKRKAKLEQEHHHLLEEKIRVDRELKQAIAELSHLKKSQRVTAV